MAIPIALTALTKQAAKLAAKKLKEFPNKDQTFNSNKKIIINNFYKIFKKEQKRKPVKNEFGVLLGGTADSNVTKSKTLTKDLTWFQGSTFEKIESARKRGKANYKGGPKPTGEYSYASRESRNKRGSVAVEEAVYVSIKTEI